VPTGCPAQARAQVAYLVAVPTVVWSLPVVSVFDVGLDPWNTGWLVVIVLSVVALMLIRAWEGRSALAARAGSGAR
jgi:hypothetical protein